MAGKKVSGARAEAVVDLQRQIGQAVKMCKKLLAHKVSWKLGTKWIGNHLDVLVEQTRELAEMPEDSSPNTSQGGNSQAVQLASADGEVNRVEAMDTSTNPPSGRARRERQHTAG